MGDYQSLFNQIIFAPLSQLSNAEISGNAEDVLKQVSEIMNHLRLRMKKTKNNCCLHVDCRILPTQGDNKEDDEYDNEDYESSDDEDDDDEYGQVLEDSLQNQTISSTALTEAFIRETKDKTYDLVGGIHNILRDQIPVLDIKPYTYKRYEVILNNEEDTLTVSEAKNNDEIPNESILNAPFCRIYNSTNSCTQINNLLTFSFHQLNDCVQIYCYVVKDGKKYGQRIFLDDLFCIIPRLLGDYEIDDYTKEAVRKNWYGDKDKMCNTVCVHPDKDTITHKMYKKLANLFGGQIRDIFEINIAFNNELYDAQSVASQWSADSIGLQSDYSEASPVPSSYSGSPQEMRSALSLQSDYSDHSEHSERMADIFDDNQMENMPAQPMPNPNINMPSNGHYRSSPRQFMQYDKRGTEVSDIVNRYHSMMVRQRMTTIEEFKFVIWLNEISKQANGAFFIWVLCWLKFQKNKMN